MCGRIVISRPIQRGTGKTLRGHRIRVILADSRVRCGDVASFLALCVGANSPPNVLLIFADDLGLHDLGCTGSTRLSRPPRRSGRESMQILAFLLGVCVRPQPVCLLTGRSPRHPSATTVNCPRWKAVLPASGPCPKARPPWPRSCSRPAMPQVLLVNGGWAAWVNPMVTPNILADRFYGYLCQFHAHNLFPRSCTR